MTTEEKRVKIAEACGWRDLKIGRHGLHGTLGGKYRRYIPDYFNDLNACREMRQRVITSPALRVDYMNALRKIVGLLCEKNKAGVPIVSDYDCMDATASEHAEAFGLALGLWS